MEMTLKPLPYLRIVMISALLLSIAAAIIFIHEDFHNAHFDSKGHQLVARRIFDNLNPGWIQIGAFWLPLPHVLYYPLARSDFLYFHGLAGTPFSMLSYLLTVYLLYRLIERIFGVFPAFCGSVLYLTNPNILYLQSSALTENLMILFMVASTYFLTRFVEMRKVSWLWFCSLSCALGILTRYDNWPVFGMIGLLLLIIDLLERRGLRTLLRNGLVLGSLGFGAMALSFFINWYTTGHVMLDITVKYTDFNFGNDSYILSFFVCLYTLANEISLEWTLIGVIGFVAVFRRRFRDPVFLTALALLGPFILYIIGYHNNHPTRIRYGLAFVPGAIIFASYWAGRSRMLAYLFCVYVVFISLFSAFHFRYGSQLLEESMRDANNLALQQDLLYYLRQNDDGTLILAAMGDIAPVLYDLKLPIKRYIHEGAKPWWNDARAHPEKYAGWVFISQDDKLWMLFHDNPEFHKHFALIGRRNYLELYRRTPDEQFNIKSHRPHGVQEKGEIRNLPL
jgi:hypothetical protein